MPRLAFSISLILGLFLSPGARADEAALTREASRALRRATEFFRNRVSTEGGYLWRYSEDLKTREGEGKASDQTVWVQPPGTPTVGLTLLDAHRATGDSYYLDAARQAGYCLVRGQLRSGGWSYKILFDSKERKRYAYRVEKPREGKQNNTTVLDDNTTQAALRLLMRLDETLRFRDAKIHEAAQYALTSLLKAQYPNGAWPQRYRDFPDPKNHPVKKADYPESWSRTFPKHDYKGYYTFNDNAMSDVIDVMLTAAKIYGEPKYREAAAKAGDFLLLAQMPQPQPAWAQQYDLDMHPAWARRFEPPAVTGGESIGVMRSLLQLYRETCDEKYLEPLPRAIAYLKKSKLPDGRLARFYELKTNRPLYFTKDYRLTHDDGDMPTHYCFKVRSGLDSVERQFERLRREGVKPSPSDRPTKPRLTKRLRARARQAVDALDEQGRWVEGSGLRYHRDFPEHGRIIASTAFCRNARALSNYLAAAQGEKETSP